MKRILNYFAAFIVGLLLVSCAPTEEDTPTPVTTYKISQASSFTEPSSSIVEYTGSGKVTNSGVVTTVSLTGSYQRTATSIVGFTGRDTITGTFSIVMNLQDGTTTTDNNIDVIEKDGDKYYPLTVTGDDDLIYAIDGYAGKSGGKLNPYQYAIENNGGFMSYNIQACGSTIGECPSPTNVATRQYTLTLMGTETISVGNAKYETYKIKEVYSQQSSTSAFSSWDATSTFWYYPKLGILKGSEISTFDSGSIVELSYSAKSHNFGKP
jgi:hypothetical protein